MKPIVILLEIGVLSIIFQVSNLAQAKDVSPFELDAARAVYHRWLVSIQQDDIQVCIGSIISESVILSAASCFGEYVELKRLMVRVRGNSENGSMHEVTYVKLHEDYNYENGRSNLALVKVSPFEFNVKVSPISLVSKNYDFGRGTNATVVGWGRGAELSEFELHCKHGIRSQFVCFPSKYISLIQAGTPLVANGVQIGVMHGNMPSDQPSKVTTSSDVSYDLDWIVNNAAVLQPLSYEEGTKSPIAYQPWLAAILQDGKFLCSGSIISENIIVSSASCFAKYMRSDLTVRVGSSAVDYGGTVHQVVLVSKHENFSYNESGSSNDVALLKFSLPSVPRNYVPINLPTKGYFLDPSDRVSVGGWSRSQERESLELRSITFRVVDCAREVSKGIICASLPLLKEMFGLPNSGAPLEHHNFLLGIQVQDSERTSPLHPRAYTDISYYHDWINQSIVSWSSNPVELGEISTINPQPWLVSIQVQGKHRCAGSIISQSIILTSASCVDRLEKIKDGWYVRVGSSSVDSGGSYHYVKDKRKHEKYSLTEHNVNDIALLKLSEPLQFNSNVKPIKLASRGYVVDRYTLANIAGWKWSYDPTAATLKDAKLQILDGCAEKVSDEQICVAPVNRKGCLADIGSPLVTNDIQIGVMSLNLACVSPQYSRVYNSISYQRDWIDKNHWEMVFEPIETGEISTIILQDPWLVSLQVQGKHVCAGSIISKSFVLTSASCLDRLDEIKDGWYVRVGSSSVDSGGSYHYVKDKKKHEDYSSTPGNANDVALVQVSEPFQFDSNVQPIKLASKEYVLDRYTLASIAGWRWSDDKSSAVLKNALGTVEQCADGIPNGQICVVPINVKGCLFDMGSPLVTDGIQIGVMSSDLSCYPPQYLRTYSSISYHRDWIEENRKSLL